MVLQRDEARDGGTVDICYEANRRPGDMERDGQPEALGIVGDFCGLEHAA